MDGSLTLGGGISGAGYGITETGSGILTLSAANSFTGPVDVAGGVLAISSDGTGATQQLGAGNAAVNLILDTGTLRLTSGTTISQNRKILLGDSGAATGGTIDVASGQTGTFLGVIANNGGTNNFTKTGLGTLVLGGSSTYTGSTSINQGTLQLSFSQAGAPSSNIINPSSALVLGGVTTNLNAQNQYANPTLTASGATAGSTNTSQTFAGTTLNDGDNFITTTQGNSTSGIALKLGNITHNAGGAVNFSVGGTASATNGIFVGSSTTNDSSGIIGGYAFFNTSSSVSDYAAVSSNGTGIQAFGGYTAVASGAISDSGVTSTPTNINLTGTSQTYTLSGTSNSGTAGTGSGYDTNIETIRSGYANTTSGTINIGSGGVLRLGVNGGILDGAGGNLTIGTATGSSGGVLTAGGEHAEHRGRNHRERLRHRLWLQY